MTERHAYAGYHIAGHEVEASVDADGVMICSVNVDDVELLRGRTTVLTGQVFSQQPSFAVTLDDAWLTDKMVDF